MSSVMMRALRSLFWVAEYQRVGTWRSLVAHLHGVQGVGGSNPLVPTNLSLLLLLSLDWQRKK